MSRYVILTSDDNLEVFVGFDKGIRGFFLTIADARSGGDEAGSYLFHNLDHHPMPQMTLEAVKTTLDRFGLILPSDLSQQLASDANVCGAVMPPKPVVTAVQSVLGEPVQVLGWQRAD